MAEVVTFESFRPPPRYDHLAWTAVSIEESIDGLAGWTVIDTSVLSPVDADPAVPALRSFTTEHGTAIDYWYRVHFVDATGDTSQPTLPLQNTAATTTTPAVVIPYVGISEMQRVLQKPAPTVPEQAAMQRCLEEAAGKINWQLGYTANNLAPSPPPAAVVEVNLDHAVELWNMEFRPFGQLPAVDGVSMMSARDTWERHRIRLTHLQTEFGFA